MALATFPTQIRTGIDPLQLGAAGNGEPGDAEYVQGAIDMALEGSRAVILPEGYVFDVAGGLDIDGGPLWITGPGALVNSGDTPMLRVGHNDLTSLLTIDVGALVSGSDGGAIIDIGNGGKHFGWDIRADVMQQDNPAASLIAANFNSSGGLELAQFAGKRWQLTTSHTVPGVYILSDSGVPIFDGITFEKFLAYQSGSQPFFYFASSSGTAMEGVILDRIMGYGLNAGAAFFAGCRNSGVRNFSVRGLSTTTAHMIHFNDVGVGGSGADSSTVFVDGYRRIDGTLGSNLYDMQFGTGSQNVEVRNISDTQTRPCQINLNSRRAVISAITANTVITGASQAQTWVLDHTPTSASTGVFNQSMQPRVRTRMHAVSRSSSVEIASGEITIPGGFFYVDVEGGSGGGASDDLETINGGNDGEEITFSCVSGSRVIVVKHNVGNIRCSTGADISLDSTSKYVRAKKDETRTWWIVSPW